MKQTELTFNVPTLNMDGSTINEPLSYTAYIDTVSPPGRAYSVPSTIAPVGGVMNVSFAALGFTPTTGVKYYVDVTAEDATGTSAPSTSISFIYDPTTPAAPTGLSVG